MDSLVTKILDNINLADGIFWQIIKNSEEPETSDNTAYYEEVEKYRFSELTKTIINQVSVYIEKQNLLLYVKRFNNQFIYRFSDKYLFEIKYDPEFTPTSRILEDIKEFISPFSEFDTISEYFNNRRMGIKFLENILHQTGYIIYESKVNPTKESQIYNIVKTVIKSTFKDSHEAGSNFRKIGKEYKPDILIPGLNVAIEYKYADSEQKLINCLEQIIIDVQGYKNDNNYKIFYAVFYVINDVVGERRFSQLWNEYNFPKNWRPIYCIGK